MKGIRDRMERMNLSPRALELASIGMYGILRGAEHRAAEGECRMKVEKPFARENASLEYLSCTGSMSYRPCYLFYRRTLPTVDYVYPVHIHPNYELITPIFRHYRCCLDGRPVTVEKGEALLIQPGQQHEDHYECGEAFHAIRFLITSGQEQTLSRLFATGLASDRQVLTIDKPETAFRILELLREEALCDEMENYEVQNGLFQAFFRLCITSCPEESFNPEFLQRARKKYIHGKIFAAFEHYIFGHPTLDDLCGFCDMTPSFLSRRCREFFAQPPLKAFMNYKIRRIKQEMAEDPKLKLKELSDRFGFKNQFHFSRLFKQFAGLSPSAFLSELHR